MENYEYIGVVTHFFDRISVAVIQLEADLYLGDWVLIYGPHTNLAQEVQSMQFEHQPIDRGVRGEEIAIKVDQPVRRGDEVFLIVDDGEDE